MQYWVFVILADVRLCTVATFDSITNTTKYDAREAKVERPRLKLGLARSEFRANQSGLMESTLRCGQDRNHARVGCGVAEVSSGRTGYSAMAV
jgi:hypothetical protein